MTIPICPRRPMLTPKYGFKKLLKIKNTLLWLFFKVKSCERGPSSVLGYFLVLTDFLWYHAVPSFRRGRQFHFFSDCSFIIFQFSGIKASGSFIFWCQKIRKKPAFLTSFMWNCPTIEIKNKINFKLKHGFFWWKNPVSFKFWLRSNTYNHHFLSKFHWNRKKNEGFRFP